MNAVILFIALLKADYARFQPSEEQKKQLYLTIRKKIKDRKPNQK